MREYEHFRNTIINRRTTIDKENKISHIEIFKFFPIMSMTDDGCYISKPNAEVIEYSMDISLETGEIINEKFYTHSAINGLVEVEAEIGIIRTNRNSENSYLMPDTTFSTYGCIRETSYVYSLKNKNRVKKQISKEYKENFTITEILEFSDDELSRVIESKTIQTTDSKENIIFCKKYTLSGSDLVIEYEENIKYNDDGKPYREKIFYNNGKVSEVRTEENPYENEEENPYENKVGR